MSFGVTTSGFSLKRFQDIVSDLQAAYIGIYGNPNLAPDSIIGQRIGLEANALSLAWEGLQLAYNAAFPSLSDVGSMPNVMALAGLTMKAATPTELVCNCVFSASGTIPIGALIADVNGNYFSAVSAIVASGSGTFSGTFACTVNGPTSLPATLNPSTYPLAIQTPESNWSTVAIVSATIGNNQETLAEARVHRANSLMIAGSATLEAIRSAVLNNVLTVTACIAIENDTDAIDINGNLPHSIAVICQSADQGSAEKLAIAQQIWEKRSGGINMNGTVSQTITDSTGRNQTIKFSYVTSTGVTVVINYSLFPGDPNPPPIDIPGALNAAIASAFSAQAIGEDVLYFRVAGALSTVPGTKVNTLTLNGSAANVSISAYSIGVLSGSPTITLT